MNLNQVEFPRIGSGFVCGAREQRMTAKIFSVIFQRVGESYGVVHNATVDRVFKFAKRKSTMKTANYTDGYPYIHTCFRVMY